MAEKQRWEELYEEYQSKMPNLTVETIRKDFFSKKYEYARKLAAIKDTESNEYKALIKEQRQYISENENAQKNLDTIISNLPQVEKIKQHRDRRQALLDDLSAKKVEMMKQLKEKKNCKV